MICLVQCSAKGPAFLAYNRKSAQMTTSWLPIRAGLPERPDRDPAGALDRCDGFKRLTDIPIYPHASDAYHHSTPSYRGSERNAAK